MGEGAGVHCQHSVCQCLQKLVNFAGQMGSVALARHAPLRACGSCLKKGQHSIFLIIHLFLPIIFFFLFRIKDTVSDILSVLLNFIANYDSNNENIPPYCL